MPCNRYVTHMHKTTSDLNVMHQQSEKIIYKVNQATISRYSNTPDIFLFSSNNWNVRANYTQRSNAQSKQIYRKTIIILPITIIVKLDQTYSHLVTNQLNENALYDPHS